MDTAISATELAKNLSDVLNRVRYRGERFVVERNGEPIASLGPMTQLHEMSWQEFIAQLGHLTPPSDGFASDLTDIQRQQPISEPPPWPN